MWRTVADCYGHQCDQIISYEMCKTSKLYLNHSNCVIVEVKILILFWIKHFKKEKETINAILMIFGYNYTKLAQKQLALQKNHLVKKWQFCLTYIQKALKYHYASEICHDKLYPKNVMDLVTNTAMDIINNALPSFFHVHAHCAHSFGGCYSHSQCVLLSIAHLGNTKNTNIQLRN